MATNEQVRRWCLTNLDKFRSSERIGIDTSKMTSEACARFDDYDENDQIPRRYYEVAEKIDKEWIEEITKAHAANQSKLALANSYPQHSNLTPETMKQRRQALGISQEKLGKQLGLTQAWVSHIETGKQTMSTVLGIAIDAVLNYLELALDSSQEKNHES